MNLAQVESKASPIRPSPKAFEVKYALNQECKNMWDFATNTGEKEYLKSLYKPSFFCGLALIGFDVALVILAIYLTQHLGILFTPMALIIIGSRQRALVVLAHDASHYSLHPNRKINNFVANWLLCFPMLMTLANFRSLHNIHHDNLGDPLHDTDYLHSEEKLECGWFAIFKNHALALDNWLVSGLWGSFPKVDFCDQLKIVLVWATIVTLTVVLFGLTFTLYGLLLWIIARATVYHSIISFVIISDHVGLWPGYSILNFSRNHSVTSPLRWIIHPHNNGLHLTHHLLPGVPCYALKRAHGILMNWQPYRHAANCDSYFWGKNSAVRSWCRKSATGGVALI